MQSVVRSQQIQRAAGAVVLAALISTGLARLVMASPLTEQSSKSMIVGTAAETDGNPFLKSLTDRVKALKDYKYDSQLTTLTKGKIIKESGKFYYKAPQMVRFEAVQAGNRSGSVVVKQSDGKIKARAGGLLGSITLNLSPQSKLLRTTNGYNIVDSDMKTLLETVRAAVGSSAKVVATQSPSDYPGLPKVYILEFLREGDSVAQRIAVDSERKLPLAWSVFNDGKLFSVVQFDKLATNANIADDLFVLGAKNGDSKSIAMVAISMEDNLRSKVEALCEQCTIGGDLVAKTKQLLDTVHKLTVALTADSQTRLGDKSGWSESGRELLLAKTNRVESLTSALRKLSPALKKFEASHGADAQGLNAHWTEDLNSIDGSISKLYEMLDQSNPDPQVVDAEARNISSNADFLDALLLKVSAN